MPEPMWSAWKRHLIVCADCTAGAPCAEGLGYLDGARLEDAPWLQAAAPAALPPVPVGHPHRNALLTLASEIRSLTGFGAGEVLSPEYGPSLHASFFALLAHGGATEGGETRTIGEMIAAGERFVPASLFARQASALADARAALEAAFQAGVAWVDERRFGIAGVALHHAPAVAAAAKESAALPTPRASEVERAE